MVIFERTLRGLDLFAMLRWTTHDLARFGNFDGGGCGRAMAGLWPG
jgi:hypothetical protein